MADTRLSTEETSQPIQETASGAIAAPSPDQPPEKLSEPVTEAVAPEPSIEPMRLNREQRREVNISHITETILESFEAHDGRMRARSHKPPKVARRICQIILHGPHSDVAAMVAVDEPYTVIVTCNRIPVKAEEWRAGVMATLTERLGMPVHITLMKEERFLAHCRNVTPFYEALSISHDTLYPYDGGAYLPLGPDAEIPVEAKVITPDKRSDERPDKKPDDPAEDAPAETPEDKPEGKSTSKTEYRWWDEPELWTYKAMHERAAGTISREEAHFEMEEPLAWLMGNTVLLSDLASGALRGDDPQAVGLYSLALTMRQQADMLYRLYHGKSSETYC